MSEDIVNKEKLNVKELEKKIKNSDKEFIVSSFSRRDLFYLLGHDKDALDYINSLTDEEIQHAINNLEIEDNEDELFYELMQIISDKNNK